MSTSNAVLNIENLTLEIETAGGPVHPVRGLSLVVQPGGFHALVGESGSGKSLTCRSIMRLGPHRMRIAEGRVVVGRTDVATLHGKQLARFRGAQAGMIFQDPGPHLNPVMRVGHQIVRPMRYHLGLSKSEAEQRVVDLVRRVGLRPEDGVLQKYPHELSGGMQQRIGIAAAISCGPKLLIADEPTTALDVTVQQSVLRLVDELRESLGLAVLFVSHDLAVVEHYADEITVLYAGTPAEHAPAGELFARPRHPYTQALLRARPTPEERTPPAIPGAPPPIDRIPEGCPFHPRCPAAIDRCRSAAPKPTGFGGGAFAACHVAAAKAVVPHE